MDEMTLLKQLDDLLEYFIKMNYPPEKTDAEIKEELKIDLTKEMFEKFHKLERDGYIAYGELLRPVQNIRTYSSTFDGRLFYFSGGYQAKSLRDATAAHQQKLEIDRLKSVDNRAFQNQKRLNKLTLWLTIGTIGATVVAIVLLFWQVYIYRHPGPIPVAVKLKIEKSG